MPVRRTRGLLDLADCAPRPCLMADGSPVVWPTPTQGAKIQFFSGPAPTHPADLPSGTLLMECTITAAQIYRLMMRALLYCGLDDSL